MRSQYAFLLAESTEIRKQSSLLGKQYAFLLAESTEIRKQSSLLSKQYAFLLAESTDIRKQTGNHKQPQLYPITTVSPIYVDIKENIDTVKENPTVG
ncbi:hypothetical protein [Nostoc sp.]|uniref:hypothetical protein n=1 Tax=Nostoc sp. TaxID=1180 RepID=UPI002FF46545